MDPFISLFGNNHSPLIWTYELAAKLSSFNTIEMEYSENNLYESLYNAADLFNLPVICTSFDTTLEATAMGYSPSQEDGPIKTIEDALDINIDSILTSGRIPQILSVISRLKNSLNCPIIAGICSPEIISNSLLSTSAKNDPSIHEEGLFVIEETLSLLTNSYLESGADGVAILAPNGLPVQDSLYTQTVSPLPNILSHYEAIGIVITKRTSSHQIKIAADLGFDLITGSTDSLQECIESASLSDIYFGFGIPNSILCSGSEPFQKFLNTLPSDALLSSEWTISPSAQPETIHELMGSL